MACHSTSISQAKKSLRKHMKSRLSELPLDEIERQSKEVTVQVLASPDFEKASRISVYLSMPQGEISTTGVVRQALLKGKKVFVPYIHKSSALGSLGPSMDMLALHSQEDLDSLQRDAWGIPTLSDDSLCDRENALGRLGPSPADDAGENGVFEGLDLILMPGMAFDHANGRLGHGKGFYDRFLQRYREVASQGNVPRSMPQLIGLSLKQQLLPANTSVPMNTDDWRVNQVFTSP